LDHENAGGTARLSFLSFTVVECASPGSETQAEQGEALMTQREKFFFLHGMAFGSVNKADAKLGNRVGQALGLTNECLLTGESEKIQSEINEMLKAGGLATG
jgi:hypothetical protein